MSSVNFVCSPLQFPRTIQVLGCFLLSLLRSRRCVSLSFVVIDECTNELTEPVDLPLDRIDFPFELAYSCREDVNVFCRGEFMFGLVLGVD